MTVEEKLKYIIGEQTFAVVALQTRVEELIAENAKLKAAQKDDLSAGMRIVAQPLEG